MGVFQASMLEAMESLREEMQSMKKAHEPNPRTSDHSNAQPMETDICGPSLAPQFGQSVQSKHGSENTGIIIPNTWNNLKGFVLEPKTLGRKETQGSGKILFTIFILRGGSVLCPY